MATIARPWMSARAAAMRLGISVYELQRRALSGISGTIRTLSEPGKALKFNAEDIERIRAEQEEPAAATA